MNAKDAWLATLGQLQTQLNRATYDTWLRHANLFSYEDGRFVVAVPNAFTKDWIERNLLTAISDNLVRLFRRPSEVQIIVYDPVADEDDAGGPLIDYPAVAATPHIHAVLLEALHPAYTLANFVVGDANRYAALLARAIVDSQPGAYSPVFFQGEIGLGKTHLLQAIARDLLERGQRAVYLSAEEFTTALVSAIQTRTTPAFRERFRLADAVLIDDIGFIEGKEQTQAELVAIWDALRNRGKTILFAGDKQPRDLPRMSKDMRSRLAAGPIAALGMPDLVLRRAIVTARCASRGLQLPTAAIDQIALRTGYNVREIQGMVDQLHAFTQLTRDPVTLHAMSALLGPLRSEDQGAGMNSGVTNGTVKNSALMNASGVPSHSAMERQAATQNSYFSAMTTGQSGVQYAETQIAQANQSLMVATIITETARYFGLQAADLLGRKRTREIVNARQIAMYIAREDTSFSLARLGTDFDGRDHTTILHGCVKVAEQIKSDTAIVDHIRQIRARLALRV